MLCNDLLGPDLTSPFSVPAMLGRFRSVVNTALDGLASIAGQPPGGSDGTNGLYPPSPDLNLKPKFSYGRPHFLKLSPDEVQASCDHSLRPILIPRNSTRLAWNAGYAEVVNAGKSKHNEDQAACHAFDIHVNIGSSSSGTTSSSPASHSSPPADALQPRPSMHAHPLNGVLHHHDASDSTSSQQGPGTTSSTVLSFTYFALFDGHAGTGCALWAANTLHYHIKEKLGEVAHLVAQLEESADGVLVNQATFPSFGGGRKKKVRFESMNHVTADSLIIGALEKAFTLMDQQVGMERHMWRITGGCTVVVALFFKSRLFIANAGDSRAIVVRSGEVALSSNDFTPESERQRIQHLATLQPHLLGNEFTSLQFPSRVTQKDLGKSILYRDHSMKGWAFKTASEEDLKYPVVLGEGKRARVLATIGVTRGFGDYDLCAFDSNIHVKPFLASAPEVFVFNLSPASGTIGEDDVVVLATDGLWDVLSSQRVAHVIANSFVQSLGSQRQKFTLAAQEVVMQARGMQPVVTTQKLTGGNPRGWRMTSGQPASGDDISCFIIPLHPAANPDSSSASQKGDALFLDQSKTPLVNGDLPGFLSPSSGDAYVTTSLSEPTGDVATEAIFARSGNPELEELLEAIRKSTMPVKGPLVERLPRDKSPTLDTNNDFANKPFQPSPSLDHLPRPQPLHPNITNSQNHAISTSTPSFALPASLSIPALCNNQVDLLSTYATTSSFQALSESMLHNHAESTPRTHFVAPEMRAFPLPMAGMEDVAPYAAREGVATVDGGTKDALIREEAMVTSDCSLQEEDELMEEEDEEESPVIEEDFNSDEVLDLSCGRPNDSDGDETDPVDPSTDKSSHDQVPPTLDANIPQTDDAESQALIQDLSLHAATDSDVNTDSVL